MCCQLQKIDALAFAWDLDLAFPDLHLVAWVGI